MIDVYLATSPSGRSYVGFSSRGVAKRWSRHIQDARTGSNTALHRAIRRYGAGAFRVRVIERMSTVAGTHRAEQLWIRELGTRTTGYNLTDGGEGTPGRVGPMRGRNHSAETRAKISAALQGNPPTRGMTGRTHAPETIAKMRAAARGRDTSTAVAARKANPPRGIIPSAETRRRMSEAHRRRLGKL